MNPAAWLQATVCLSLQWADEAEVRHPKTATATFPTKAACGLLTLQRSRLSGRWRGSTTRQMSLDQAFTLGSTLFPMSVHGLMSCRGGPDRSFKGRDRTHGVCHICHDLLAEGLTRIPYHIERITGEDRLRTAPRPCRISKDTSDRSAVSQNLFDGTLRN